MPFYHSKNARLFVDQYDLSNDFSEFSAAPKAGIADATVYGQGSKSFIGGLLEGQLTAKGFFDDSTPGADFDLAQKLGSSTNTVLTFLPSGIPNVGKSCVTAEAAMTDYSITAPISNVVGVSASWQADNGLKSGVVLWDPFATFPYINTVITNSTTVTAGSNGVHTATFTGNGVLNVAGVTGTTNNSGTVLVTTSGSVATVAYTGISGSAFIGCTTLFGGGVMSTGNPVNWGSNDKFMAPGATTNRGLVVVAHVPVLSGTGSPTLGITLQHSDDNITWTDLKNLNVPNPSMTSPTAVYGLVPSGITIQRLLRVYAFTTGTTIGFQILAAAARL